MTEQEKQMVLEFGDLIITMTDLNKRGIPEKDNILYEPFHNQNMFVLPNGNKANILGIALDMNFYVVARHVILNNESYNIDTNCCYIDQNNNVYNAKEVFENSLDYYKDEEELDNMLARIDTLKYKSIASVPFFIRNPEQFYKLNSIERNIECSKEIEKLFKDRQKNRL